MAYEKGKKRKGSASVVCCVTSMDWECEQDLQAVARAAAVHKDPERMKAVQNLAKRKLDESKAKKAEAEGMIDLGEGKTI